MLRAFVGHGIAALLSQGLLGTVFGVLEAFAFHTGVEHILDLLISHLDPGTTVGVGALGIVGVIRLADRPISDLVMADGGDAFDLLPALGMAEEGAFGVRAGAFQVGAVHGIQDFAVIVFPIRQDLAFLQQRVVGAGFFMRSAFGQLVLIPLASLQHVLIFGSRLAETFGKDALHLVDAAAFDAAKAVFSYHLVHQFLLSPAVAPAHIQTFGIVKVDETAVEHLVGKGGHGTHGNGADAVSIAVEVGFHYPVRIEDAAVGAQAGSVLIFGAVDANALSLVRTGLGREFGAGLGAAHGAAVPAAVRYVLQQVKFAEHVSGDLLGFRMHAVTVVHDGQQVVSVHNVDDVSGTDLSHLADEIVVHGHFAVDTQTGFVQELLIQSMVHVGAGAAITDDQAFDVLVAEHGADAAAAGLLQTGAGTTLIPEGEVQAADGRKLGSLSGGNGGYVDLVIVVLAVHVEHLLGKHMRVDGVQRSFLDGDLVLVAVDEDDDFLVSNSLDLKSVETGELEVGSEEAANVGVDNAVGQRRKGANQGLAGAGVLSIAGQRTRRHDDLVIGTQRIGVVIYGIPQIIKVEALAADEVFLHALGNDFFLEFVGADVDVQGTAVVAFDDLRRLIGVFGQYFTGLFDFFYVILWGIDTRNVGFRIVIDH